MYMNMNENLYMCISHFALQWQGLTINDLPASSTHITSLSVLLYKTWTKPANTHLQHTCRITNPYTLSIKACNSGIYTGFFARGWNDRVRQWGRLFKRSPGGGWEEGVPTVVHLWYYAFSVHISHISHMKWQTSRGGETYNTCTCTCTFVSQKGISWGPPPSVCQVCPGNAT